MITKPPSRVILFAGMLASSPSPVAALPLATDRAPRAPVAARGALVAHRERVAPAETRGQGPAPRVAAEAWELVVRVESVARRGTDREAKVDRVDRVDPVTPGVALAGPAVAAAAAAA